MNRNKFKNLKLDKTKLSQLRADLEEAFELVGELILNEFTLYVIMKDKFGKYYLNRYFNMDETLSFSFDVVNGTAEQILTSIFDVEG